MARPPTASTLSEQLFERRRFLALLGGTAVTIPLAGCASPGEGEGDEGGVGEEGEDGEGEEGGEGDGEEGEGSMGGEESGEGGEGDEEEDNLGDDAAALSGPGSSR